MKTTRIWQGVVAATLIGASSFISVPANAAHEMIYAIDTQNNLINFWSDIPGNVINSYNVTGLADQSEEVRGIDYWNGVIYALGGSSRLYTINPNTGAATLIGSQFSPLLNGQTFAADNGPAGFQVTSGLSGGQNLVIDRSTGVALAQPNLAYAAGDAFVGQSPRVDALAYDWATGVWFAGDTLQNTLATFNPATGILNTIGFLGIDASRYNGMDISQASGVMYIGTPAASSGPQANLYSVDKATGMATLIGSIGAPGDDYLVRAMTVVPEPSSLAFLAMGAFGLMLARRRE